jgi:hypothetical protein
LAWCMPGAMRLVPQGGRARSMGRPSVKKMPGGHFYEGARLQGELRQEAAGSSGGIRRVPNK